jgi:uncharacterized membrane protein YeaQ/YmgE (transglycosylase-associated protein family)
MRKRIGEASALRQAAMIALLVAIAPLAGLLAGTITGAGRSVGRDYFIVCGSIGPLVGLALFIDISVVINTAVASQGLTKANKGLARVLVYSNAALMLTSAGFALYALGSNVQTTFLVTVAVAPLLIQTLLLTEAALFKVRAITLSPG